MINSSVFYLRTAVWGVLDGLKSLHSLLSIMEGSGGGVKERVSQCDTVPLLIVQYYLSYR